MVLVPDDAGKNPFSGDPADEFGRVKCGVRFESPPPKEDTSPPYVPSRLQDLECERISAKGCILSCETAIERYSSDPLELARAHGRSHEESKDPSWFERKSKEVVAKEEALREDCELEVFEYDCQIEWINRGRVFDFTRQSYATASYWEREMTAVTKFFDDIVEDERRTMAKTGNWPVLTTARVAYVMDLDEEIHRVGDHALPPTEYQCADYLAKSDDSGRYGRAYLLAAYKEIEQRDPNLIRELRDLGTTPGIIRRLNEILQGQRHRRAQSETLSPVRLVRRRTAARSRCSRGPVRRHTGSRRSSAGSPSGDDGGGGGSDPPDSRRLLARTTSNQEAALAWA